MATTTGTPKVLAFSICFLRLQKPAVTRGMFFSVYSGLRGVPATTGGPPPCILRARTVATRTTALGTRPE